MSLDSNETILPSHRSISAATIPWWIALTVVIGSLLMLTGAVLALVHPIMLVSPDDQINHAVRIYAGYLFSRNLTLAVFLLVALVLRAEKSLGFLMLLTAFVQCLDAGLDLIEGRLAIAPGIIIFAMLLFWGSARLTGSPFWKIRAWNESARLRR
jgi:hypothetical protein